jgi:hypothetical protein
VPAVTRSRGPLLSIPAFCRYSFRPAQAAAALVIAAFMECLFAFNYTDSGHE